MKNNFKAIAMLLVIVFASSYDWSWGLAIVLIMILAHIIQHLWDEEDKEIARIEQRQMEIDEELEIVRDEKFRYFMEVESK